MVCKQICKESTLFSNIFPDSNAAMKLNSRSKYSKYKRCTVHLLLLGSLEYLTLTNSSVWINWNWKIATLELNPCLKLKHQPLNRRIKSFSTPHTLEKKSAIWSGLLNFLRNIVLNWIPCSQLLNLPTPTPAARIVSWPRKSITRQQLHAPYRCNWILLHQLCHLTLSLPTVNYSH